MPAVAAPPVKPLNIEAAPFVDHGPFLSDNYGLDRLVAMVRDPEWVFLYWELNGCALRQLTSVHAADAKRGLRWVLRVSSLCDMSSYMVDVDVGAGNWYLKVAPAACLRVELGFTDMQDQFLSLVKSDEVRMPKATVSASLEERWMSLPDGEDYSGRVARVGAKETRKDERRAFFRLPVEELRSSAPVGSSNARRAAAAEQVGRVPAEQLGAIAPSVSSPRSHLELRRDERRNVGRGQV
ncbi:MAG TPA: DUF4912 domain-containing protein [Planctomycetota bacterium]